MNRITHPLDRWGWSESWARQILPDEIPARVLSVDKTRLSIQHANGVAVGFWRPNGTDTDIPAVGDWCVFSSQTGMDGDLIPIRRILSRRTVISRRAAGKATRAQVLAANVDTAVLVCSLDRSSGVRGLDRLIVLVRDGGARPLVVLNKADMATDLDQSLYEAQRTAPGVKILVVSAKLGRGLTELGQCFAPGETAVLLGPSGVGKSTLTNALAGNAVETTGSARATDGRGRHTTTRRTMHRLPSGLLLIDTPGLRELGIWLEGDGLREAFADISSLSEGCRFRDCTHTNEPGCEVRQAMEAGELEPRRFWRFLELQEEAKVLQDLRNDPRHRSNSKARHKQLSKTIRRMKKG